MKTIKFVKLPGEVREFVVNDGTTVKELLTMAGVTNTSEISVQGDDDKVELDDTVDAYELISVSKRLKGAI